MPGGGSRKARVVLKLLALRRGRSVSIDQLVDAVWPDALPTSPPEQLAVLISRLRATLGRERITFSDGGYRLHADWVDLDEFEVHLRDAEDSAAREDHDASLAHARAALRLVRGPLLADEPDVPWARAERVDVERAVARARHVAAWAGLAIGDLHATAATAGAALAADPFDEVALRLVMLAEQRRGRIAEGLAEYARVRSHLAEELGVDPSPETETVHLALLQRSAAPASSRLAAGEATARSSLIGRSTELRLLDTELDVIADRGLARFVVIEGEAGIGKSALLAEVGRRAQERGWLWLGAMCEPLFDELPMQCVLDALVPHLPSLPPGRRLDLMGAHRLLLERLLGDSGSDRDDSWLGARDPTMLFPAIDAVFDRLTAEQPVVLTIDDVHRAGRSSIDLLIHLRRSPRPLLVLAARRREPGAHIPADRTVHLGPLELADAVALVGAERGAELHLRAGGNPLFLTLLAASDPGEVLPASLVDVVADIASGLGPARDTVRAAAVLGGTIDVDLLAAVSRTPPVELLSHLDAASERLLLDGTGGSYVFRHELVRAALAETMSAAGAALLHRESARLLSARQRADPVEVAHHARLGGDLGLAAAALDEAAAAAAARYDRRTAEELLDQAIRWSDTSHRRLARARIRTMRGEYDNALVDVDVALAAGAGAPALEIGAWAAYFGRRPDAARAFADDGAALAADGAVRSSCLAVAGRVRHAAGDLAGAEPLLEEAVATAQGPGRAFPTVWLGVLRSHQSRPGEALSLLRQITRVDHATEHTPELMHALMFTAHASALGGNPGTALDALRRYDDELAIRHVPRYAGRAANFRGWILRALGQWDRADDENRRAVDELGTVDFPETVVASALDLASAALLRRDVDDAGAHLARAEAAWGEHLTFGWRLQLRLQLERARLELLFGHAIAAADLAAEVAAEASRLGVPRYSTVARLVLARARHEAGNPVELEAVGHDLDALDRAVGIDAWWITAETASSFGVARWEELAAARAAALADAAGSEGAALEHTMRRVIR